MQTTAHTAEQVYEQSERVRERAVNQQQGAGITFTRHVSCYSKYKVLLQIGMVTLNHIAESIAQSSKTPKAGQSQ